ncbi:MAG: hypothetical protein JST51_01955 [Armatimonadetes bacterium]|nr:hypothetical protein [Armatimonadota bacterium]
MKRTDLQDTSIEMHRARVRLSREKGPSWRLKKTLELMAGMKVVRKTTRKYRPE